jgi:hypothetical protein
MEVLCDDETMLPTAFTFNHPSYLPHLRNLVSSRTRLGTPLDQSYYLCLLLAFTLRPTATPGVAYSQPLREWLAQLPQFRALHGRSITLADIILLGTALRPLL